MLIINTWSPFSLKFPKRLRIVIPTIYISSKTLGTPRNENTLHQKTKSSRNESIWACQYFAIEHFWYVYDVRVHY